VGGVAFDHLLFRARPRLTVHPTHCDWWDPRSPNFWNTQHLCLPLFNNRVLQNLVSWLIESFDEFYRWAARGHDHGSGICRQLNTFLLCFKQTASVTHRQYVMSRPSGRCSCLPSLRCPTMQCTDQHCGLPDTSVTNTPDDKLITRNNNACNKYTEYIHSVYTVHRPTETSRQQSANSLGSSKSLNNED